jgi:hypothetical protein
MKNSRSECGRRRQTRWALTLALGAVVAFAPSLTWSQQRGQCARIDTPWPMVLPDGSIHEAGSLNLCLQQMWTPASGLHEIRVNGKSLGLFMSRVGTGEGPVEGMPVVVFQRNGTDERSLLGYAWPDGAVMKTYVLDGFGRSPRKIARKAPLPLLESVTTEILIAALP